VGATEVGHPLDDWGRLDEYIERGIPDPFAPGRLAAALGPARAFHGAGTYCFGLLGAVFYHIFSIRGMENALADFRANPVELGKLVDALRDYALELVRSWSEIGVDALMLLDDWGSQRALMISPGIWRDFFKDGYATIIREAHALGMDVILHSCGNVTAIVEELIDVGLDVLDPVQTSTMNIEELARRFGGRISFCGTIDVQDLLPRASPAGVKDAIRRARDVLGRRFESGLILAPTNTITPEVPFENLRAMFEACHERDFG
jgi:uroporphyrinogen decarboxylase